MIVLSMRRMRIFRNLLGLAGFAALCTATPTSAKPGYQIDAAPEWVNPVPLTPEIREAPALVATSPSEYLLVDRQVKITATNTLDYTHIAHKVISRSSVESDSRIEIAFEPNSESVILHSLQLWRGAKVIDQKGRAHFSVLRRESELEDSLLDGDLTINILLEDVRPGDIIEYSYSNDHSDTYLHTRFNSRYTLQWSEPVLQSHLRILHPVSQTLHIKAPDARFKLDTTPELSRSGSTEEMKWHWTALSGIPYEDDTPGWFTQYPDLQISAYNNWQEVAAWTANLYRTRRTSGEMQTLVKSWVEQTKDPAQRALLAIRFVQDDIRYTGIEIGSGAFAPRFPDEVVHRRFGDCKDKAHLLVTLLQAMNIHAVPVLVHSRHRKGVANDLPGYISFDHVITRVDLDGHQYWVDGTHSFQGGTLKSMIQANFGKGLIVAPDTTQLVDFPSPVLSTPELDLHETFDVKNGKEGIGYLTVETAYTGSRADAMRREIAESTIKDFERDYLNYYKSNYPGIQATEPPQFKDDRDGNKIVISEKYQIKPAFSLRPDKSWLLEFYPSNIRSRTAEPKLRIRTSPLKLSYPLFEQYRMDVLVPESWTADSDKTAVKDSSFQYRSLVKYSPGHLTGEYTYQALGDEVPIQGFSTYSRHLQEAHDASYYKFSFDPDATAAIKSGSEYLSIAVLLALIAGCSFGFIFWHRADLMHISFAVPYDHLRPASPISGWLLLLGVTIGVRLLHIISVILDYSNYVWLSTWNGIGSNDSANTAQWLKLGFLLNVTISIAILILVVITLIKFINHQRSFVANYIQSSVIECLTYPAGCWLMSSILSQSSIFDTKSAWYFFSIVVVSIVGILYVLRSQQVRAVMNRTSSRMSHGG